MIEIILVLVCLNITVVVLKLDSISKKIDDLIVVKFSN